MHHDLAVVRSLDDSDAVLLRVDLHSEVLVCRLTDPLIRDSNLERRVSSVSRRGDNDGSMVLLIVVLVVEAGGAIVDSKVRQRIAGARS